MQLESLLNGINNELDKIRNSIKECLRNTQLNKDDIAVRKEFINLFKSCYVRDLKFKEI